MVFVWSLEFEVFKLRGYHQKDVEMTFGRTEMGAICLVEAVHGFAEGWVWI